MSEYRIFRGTEQQPLDCLESVRGFFQAKARMRKLAASLPGKYFFCDAATLETMEQIDTSPRCVLLRSDSQQKRAKNRSA